MIKICIFRNKSVAPLAETAPIRRVVGHNEP